MFVCSLRSNARTRTRTHATILNSRKEKVREENRCRENERSTRKEKKGKKKVEAEKALIVPTISCRWRLRSPFATGRPFGDLVRRGGQVSQPPASPCPQRVGQNALQRQWGETEGMNGRTSRVCAGSTSTQIRQSCRGQTLPFFAGRNGSRPCGGAALAGPDASTMD